MSTFIQIGPTDINKENFPYINSLFNNSSFKVWQTIRQPFFPNKKIDKKTYDLALIQLLYLASINEQNDKAPFSKAHAKTFHSSNQWNNTTTLSLKLLFVVNAILLVGVTLIPLIPASSHENNATDDASMTSQEKGLLALVASIAFLTNGFSFWATGFSPNYLSNAANHTQDTLTGIENTYENLACRLLRLHKSTKGNEEASKIAHSIDVKILKKRCILATHNKVRSKLLISDLKEAVNYIKTGDITYLGNSKLLNIVDSNQNL